MSHKTAATVAHTIGIDTGKNTLHLIGLDDQGAIVLREKIVRCRRDFHVARTCSVCTSAV
jgi:transposase